MEGAALGAPALASGAVSASAAQTEALFIGGYASNISVVAGDEIGPYDACLRMPLIFRLPGEAGEGKVRHQPATLLDVIPTILGFSGLPQPWKMHGHDLRPHLRDPDLGTDRLIYMENFLGDCRNREVGGRRETS